MAQKIVKDGSGWGSKHFAKDRSSRDNERVSLVYFLDLIFSCAKVVKVGSRDSVSEDACLVLSCGVSCCVAWR
jgi:hypothetical protein